MREIAALVAGLGALLTLAGCGASDDPARARARHFVEALSSGDPAAACADLAEEARSSLEEQEGKPCQAVIGDQDLPTAEPTGSVGVFGSMAQVHTGQDTLFLSRFPDGWRIVAAGCKQAPGDEPYSCAVEVG